MTRPIEAIPQRYREDYLARQTAVARQRVPLLCLTTVAIAYAVSLQYLVRAKLTRMETFVPFELAIWTVLGLGTALILWINRKSSTLSAHKRNAHLFNWLFGGCLTALGLLYPQNAVVFSFYYGTALLLVSLVMPWRLRDLGGLFVLFGGFYTFFYFCVREAMRVTVPVLPRFHPYIDGMIFIAITYVVAHVVRRKEIETDVRNFLLLKEVEEKNRRNEEELRIAATVHDTLIPKSSSTPRAEIAVTYVPVSHVGGDYATYKHLDDGRLVVFISDVAGHGVPAALLVNRIHSEFARLAEEKCCPSVILNALHRMIAFDFQESNMFLSAFCGVFDFEKQTFTYSNYGHPDQYFYHASQSKLSLLESSGGLLGVAWSSQDGVDREIRIGEGDTLLLFTDGVTEAAGAGGDLFGEDRLTEFFRVHYSVSSADFNLKLIEELKRFAPAGFRDDVFILSVTVKKERPDFGKRRLQQSAAAAV